MKTRKLFFALLLTGIYSSGFSQLTGNYTIDPSLPATAVNYQSIESATEDLRFGTRPDSGPVQGPGVNAAVVFDIAPGTYNEKMNLYLYSGVSAINTVTFQSSTLDSSDVIIDYSPASIGYGELPLLIDGAHYIRIKSLTLQNTSTAYSTVIDIRNSGSYNEFVNNRIVGAVGIGELVDFPNTLCDFAGSCPSPGQSRDNLFEGNHFINGAQAFFVEKGGINDLSKPNGLIIRNNIMDGFSARGINVFEGVNPVIENNVLTAGQSATTNSWGISITNSEGGNVIVRNNIANLETNVSGGAIAVGIYVADDENAAISTDSIIIENNCFSATSVDAAVGCAISNVDSMEVLLNNNSILVNGADAANCAGFFITNGSVIRENISLSNNNIANVGFGSGVLFLDSTDMMANMDFNNFDIVSDSLIVYGVSSSVHATLNTWNTQTGLDANSLTLPAGYVSSTDLHTLNCALFGTGTMLSTVIDDIDGQTRNNPPTIGADEINEAPTSNITKTICEGAEYELNGMTYTTAGTYMQTVSGSNPFCDTTVTLNLLVVDCTGLIENEKTIGVYPNPVIQNVKISYQGLNESTEATVIDATGRVLFIIMLSGESGVFELDMEHLSAGTYYLQVDNQVRKLIKR